MKWANFAHTQADTAPVWKLHDFSITLILREINFGDPRNAKSAILTHLEVLNFVLGIFALFEG